MDSPGDVDERPSDDGERVFASMDLGLREFGIPLENHEFIRQMAAELGIVRFVATRSYLKAARPGGGPALNINYGWTNGFMSEEEALRAGGATTEVWPSDRGSGQWGVSHPVNQLRDPDGSSASSGSAKDYDTCPRCFTTFSASGACFCD